MGAGGGVDDDICRIVIGAEVIAHQRAVRGLFSAICQNTIALFFKVGDELLRYIPTAAGDNDVGFVGHFVFLCAGLPMVEAGGIAVDCG